MEKMARYVIPCVIGMLLAEGASMILISLKDGRFFLASRAIGERQFFKENYKDDPYRFLNPFEKNQIHPFFGYVGSKGTTDYNEWGFVGPGPVFSAHSDVKIAILGGSVAWELGAGGGYLLTALKSTKTFAGKKIRLMTFAHGGYRQPQQSIILNYFLSLGAQFDWVINVDGFNEATFAFNGNGVNQGVHFSYPNLFVEEVAKLSVRKIDDISSRWKYWEWRKSQLTDWIFRLPLQRSAFVHLLWRAPHGAMGLRQQTLERQLAGLLLPDIAKGPPNRASDMTEQLIQNWFESSLLMQAMCLYRGIHYWHFLQPNQYVPNSKNFGEEEARVALASQDILGSLVERGYPRLQSAGEKLRKQGVHFRDLSNIFSETREPLYRDHCCHLNALGNEMLSQAIVQAIDAGGIRKNELKPLG